MGSERNFRSYYYEKMGFRGVEEKKSLDILLRERPIDLDRIHNFCLRFPLPGIYRIQVWQLLLGILPKYTTSTEFVWCQRAEQYKESERALVLSKKITANTEQRVKIAAVWLLERNWLKSDLSLQLKESDCQNFLAIVSSLEDMVSTPEEVYWLSRGLFSILETSLSDSRPMFDCLNKLLCEDSSLLSHLEVCGGVTCPSYHHLLKKGFAGIFQASLLVRLWDKLIGGSSKVLVYVMACALFRCRMEVMSAKTQDEIVDIISNMSEDRQDVVLTMALDMWEMDGCPVYFGADLCASTAETDSENRPQPTTGLESRLSMEINVN